MSMKSTPDIYIIYATETGNAKSVAWEISCALYSLKLEFSLHSIDELYNDTSHEGSYLCKLPTSCRVILVVSTTGQGEVPSSMKPFWRLLLSASPPLSVLGWSFSIFGLGDSRYREFNSAARRLRVRLKQLGATEFYRLGLGNDQHRMGFQAELYPWLHRMVQALSGQRIPEAFCETLHHVRIPPKYHIQKVVKNKTLLGSRVWDSVPLSVLFEKEKMFTAQKEPEHFFEATVMKNQRMTSQEHPHVVHQLRLSIPVSQRFVPGSCLLVYPQNSDEKTLKFIKDILHEDPNNRIIVHENPSFPFGSSSRNSLIQHPFHWKLGRSMTLFEVIKYYFDIDALPTQITFQILSQACGEGMLKDKLVEFSTRNAEGCQMFHEFIHLERHSISDILWDFNVCVRNLTLNDLFTLLPLIEPRKYSIASAPLWYSAKVWWCLGGGRLLMKCPVSLMSSAPLFYLNVHFGSERHSKKKKNKATSEKDVQSIWKEAEDLMDRLTRMCRDHFWTHLCCESCPRKGDQTIDLCVGQSHQRTPFGVSKPGLCSSYLIRCQPKERILCRLEVKSCLDGCGGENVPLLLLATGTGVAPVRALMQRRSYVGKRSAVCDRQGEYRSVEEPEPLRVFLGFRHPESDFLFSRDWFLLASTLTSYPPGELLMSRRCLWSWNCSISIVFSQLNPQRKMYIQDGLLQKVDEIRRLFSFSTLEADKWMEKNRVCVVIGGRSHPMPTQVMDYLTSILSEEPQGEEAVRVMMRRKKRQGELVYETWGV